MMQFFTGKAGTKFLVLLFSLLSALTLCSADTGTSGHHVNHSPDLQERKAFPELTAFKEKLKRADKTIYTNEQDYMDFKSPGKKIFASDAYAGCIGMVMVSQKGAMIGHYNMDEASLDRGKPKLKNIYEAHKTDLAGGQVWVYAHVEYKDGRPYKQARLVDKFTSTVKEITGQQPQIQQYIEAVDAWFDQDGEPLADDPDLENMIGGAFIVENPGGGSAKSLLEFLDIDMIKKTLAITSWH
ncbi:hypothetical protein F5Y13DRAFT_185918 [Hypoxylon sp. FL1857]|nr:hypothetical protein F5Y13DRAFT_185918 [Hypoxylon sp. FL1857]